VEVWEAVECAPTRSSLNIEVSPVNYHLVNEHWREKEPSKGRQSNLLASCRRDVSLCAKLWKPSVSIVHPALIVANVTAAPRQENITGYVNPDASQEHNATPL